jgi:hypothetical protein
MVTLLDGRIVPSDSEEWRAECEARHMLSFPLGLDRGMTGETRKTALERIGQKRGPEAMAALSEAMSACEPDHVLRLPNKHQRNRYIEAVSHFVGENAAEHLKQRVMALHKARAASNCAESSA